jgi:hypothetical protein
MKFTVVWDDTQLNQLAKLYLKGGQVVTDSADRIELELHNDAHLKGEPSGPLRVYKDPHGPLAVLYLALPEDRQVWVVQVKCER